jgi:two-component system, NarL family, response regulator DevR
MTTSDQDEQGDRTDGSPPITIRTVVIDDHEVVRKGVAALLDAADDIVVCGQGATVTEAITVTLATMPDVVLMDVRLLDGSGIEATREIRARCPATKVIMLTSFSDEEALLASIMAGASGYVLKQIRGNDLVAAIRHVAAGRSLLDPNVTSGLFERLRKASALKDQKLASLSSREEQILTLVAQGLTNREIADELGVAEKTVKNAVSHILTKLQVAHRSAAAVYLTRHTTLPGS